MKTHAQLAEDLASLDLADLPPDQVREKMATVIGHLDDDDADAVVCLAQDMLRNSAAKDFATADAQERFLRLARATGCPNGSPVIPWLIQQGLIVKDGDDYSLTPKATGLRLVP